ncbi:MAG: glutamate synthase (NADPH), homotetrameric [Deltaproteobacteria bacterium]|nr:MAG: glutamate synthase (NADPH), homotetrameric [Deltaproteobacteria bacterium]
MAGKREKTPRQKMPEQKPEIRRWNFKEVPLGFDDKTALLEASRCLKCKKPACVEGCPVSVPIPQFISLVLEKKYDEASRQIRKKNFLPAVCGRVCPQESQCEGNCILGKKGEPVAIGSLERFVADREIREQCQEENINIDKTGRKVAVIGSGPSGLTVAGDLALKGHEVYVYEAFHKGGGVLVYGIPEFRLPKTIVEYEIKKLESYGVKFIYNYVIGKIKSIEDLFNEGFDAVYIGVGAGLPRFLNIEGENFNGVYSANEYLTRANLMKAYDPLYDTPAGTGKNVVVVGAGNVAMDAARTALRLGGEKVSIVYRRSREEMPARFEEIHHAEDEGIQLELLTNPVKILGDSNGWIKGMECVRMELGEPDDSGRRRPVEIKGSNFILDCDLVIIAVGSGANPVLSSSESSLALTSRGYIEADSTTGKTSVKGVWAGGDIVTGQATVIEAMGAGRKAATDMDEYLSMLN